MLFDYDLPRRARYHIPHQLLIILSKKCFGGLLERLARALTKGPGKNMFHLIIIVLGLKQLFQQAGTDKTGIDKLLTLGRNCKIQIIFTNMPRMWFAGKGIFTLDLQWHSQIRARFFMQHLFDLEFSASAE